MYDLEQDRQTVCSHYTLLVEEEMFVLKLETRVYYKQSASASESVRTYSVHGKPQYIDIEHGLVTLANKIDILEDVFGMEFYLYLKNALKEKYPVCEKCREMHMTS